MLVSSQMHYHAYIVIPVINGLILCLYVHVRAYVCVCVCMRAWCYVYWPMVLFCCFVFGPLFDVMMKG